MHEPLAHHYFLLNLLLSPCSFFFPCLACLFFLLLARNNEQETGKATNNCIKKVKRRAGQQAVMGQEEAAPLPGTVVVASWEQAVKTSALGNCDDMPPDSPRKVKAPARRLSVPPPPGRPTVPGTRSFSRARAVRPEDDPFLAAYLACTRTGTCAGGGTTGTGRTGNNLQQEPVMGRGRRRFTWAGLGLSCKGSGAAVEQSMVKLAKRPELHPGDA